MNSNNSKPLNLKYILAEYNISYSQLAGETRISKTAISNIINHNIWPDRQDKAEIQTAISGHLRTKGVPADLIKSSWKQAADSRLSERSRNPARVTASVSQPKIVWRRTMLDQDVLDRCGLSRDPFNNEMETISDVLETPQHNFVFKKAKDAARRSKLIAIHGPVGSGKGIVKALLYDWLEAQKNYLISEPFIAEKDKCKPSIVADSMIQDFLYKRGGISEKGYIRAPRNLEAKMRWLYNILKNKLRDGKRMVLIIDEAHLLPTETLKALKTFHELQDGFKKMIAIIIFGQEELVERLSDYRIRELSARINTVELKPIPNMVAKYITHKITRAGGKAERIIDDTAMKTVARLMPNANPLMINCLVSSSILKSWKADTFPVTAEVVETAYKEMAA